MSKKNCGCSDPSRPNKFPDKSYLMVEASASEASTCSPDLQFSGVEECAKQEPMFDVVMSDFLLPLPQNQVSIQVCNPSIYSVGMWIETVNPSISLKITAITNNIITAVNRCDDGSAISDNPEAGFQVLKGTVFVVGSEPSCSSPEAERQKVLDALATATQVCIPNLEQSTPTSTVQMVGLMQNDPNNTGKCKGLQRVIGVLFTNGVPYFSRTRTVNPNTYNQYRSLMIHTNTNEVVEMGNESTWPGISGANNQYFKSVKAGNNEMVGPAYLSNYYANPTLVEQSTNGGTPRDWPTFTNEIIRTFDLSSYAQLQTTRRNLTHYFAHVRLEIGCIIPSQSNQGWPMMMTAYLNGNHVVRCISMSDQDYVGQLNSVSTPIRINDINQELVLRMTTASTPAIRYYYRLSIDGISF